MLLLLPLYEILV